MADFLFVHSVEGGWWLKISNMDELTEYHNQTGGGSKYEGALMMYWKWKKEGKDFPEVLEEMTLQERINLQQSRDFKYLQCAVMQAQNVGGTIFDGFRCLNIEIGFAEMETLREYGTVFINCVGGHTHGIEYDQFCRRKALVFPNYKPEDIRIKQFDGGNHWYVYIGDMQMRHGDQLKWNTYKQAREAAEELINA